MAEPLQVGEAQAREVLRELRARRRQAGQLRVGRRQDDDVARRSARGRPAPRRPPPRPAWRSAGARAQPPSAAAAVRPRPARRRRPPPRSAGAAAGLIGEPAGERVRRHDAPADLVANQHHRARPGPPSSASSRSASRSGSRSASRTLVSHKVRQSTSTARLGTRRPAQRLGQFQRLLDDDPVRTAPLTVMCDPRRHLAVERLRRREVDGPSPLASTSASAWALLPERTPPRTSVRRGRAGAMAGSPAGVAASASRERPGQPRPNRPIAALWSARPPIQSPATERA